VAEATAAQPPEGLSREAEEAAFYQETALNATWTGSRLILGSLSFGFGAFAFAYFFLRSVNSHGLWHPPTLKSPQPWAGALIMALIVVSAAAQSVGLRRIKAGNKAFWQVCGSAAMAFGLGAIGLQVWQLLNLPFFPGSAGYASVFVGFSAVFVAVIFAAMIWLEILIAKAARIPGISFVEQPPTYAEAFRVQRFQASLSAFTVVWNYLAVIAVVFWVLFYVVS
jgi:heme/copper-type cytochrome/quinol oxidase subunit 3